MAPSRKWLFKSEPNCYSYDDLLAEPSGVGHWDGVRSYQVRNMMRDEMSVGDLVLFYHSSCPEPGIVGTAEIVSAAKPDPTQFDPASENFDPKSDPKNPRWLMVDIRPLKKFDRLVPLAELKATPGLEGMVVTKRGNRLSITPVTNEEWEIVCRLGKRS
ncbi:EVE domain-containing protein [Fimbriimonadia bacterium ATM]|nr:MAG: EVE domain-containing protein [Armatimonadota bacterium]MBC6970099.1 EVE domain-containing protein [Armatimonadota bacterium]MCE7900737.1 EVE domain-containing protein [Armatimonadetes bacterium ATM1]MDL1928617.1 EVE domain-containing protein [Fimbriimonadia bacterium ATM]RIJ96210.1 MAG: EVE domain-containing protein [Armatimonadota bacterium]